uniref:Secreted protein n=1 Tax=Apteryx owenii TaxID=8824 RepID=A0A8B9QBU7_APTOW
MFPVGWGNLLLLILSACTVQVPELETDFINCMQIFKRSLLFSGGHLRWALLRTGPRCFGSVLSNSWHFCCFLWIPFSIKDRRIKPNLKILN